MSLRTRRKGRFSESQYAEESITMKEFEIKGTVMPGFESVKRLYEHNMRTLAESNTQLCVYYGEEKVVDLWASVMEEPNFSADSLSLIHI